MKDTKQQWFKDAKYGLFIHWGLYSILAGEWNGQKTDWIGEWIMNTLDIPVEEYEKLAAQFNPVNFDADSLVKKAAQDWGMKYLVVTAKHHDGFALYHSKYSPYNVVDATPYGKDIVRALSDACKKYGMKFCFYYSQAQDWHDPDGYMAMHDNSHKDFRRYLDRICLPQLRELLTGYGDIGLIWFDTPMGITDEQSREIVDLVKSLQPNCIVSGRIGNNLGEYMTTGDNFIPALPYYGDWEVPATLNDTWGFKRDDHNWKKPEDLIRLLVKINSRGGNYLLNIGPDALGNIPQPSIDALDRVGAFLRHNGDSIYGTCAVAPSTYEVEGCMLTAKAHKLFIHMLRPFDKLHLMNIGNTIRRAYLLQTGEEIEVKQSITCEGDSSWEFPSLPARLDSIDTVICVELVEEELVFEQLPE